jgi:hypothetical protein
MGKHYVNVSEVKKGAGGSFWGRRGRWQLQRWVGG